METGGFPTLDIDPSSLNFKCFPFGSPAGWTSSGLRAPHTGGWAGSPDGTCRGHWLIPLLKKKTILLCIVQARNSSNFVRHPYAGALLSSARADVKIFIRRHCWRNKSSGPCTVVIPVQSTVREFHTSLPCRRTSPLDTSCNSLLGNCTKKKKRRVISGAMLLEKKENTICALTVPAQAFKSDEHQCSSSRASTSLPCRRTSPLDTSCNSLLGNCTHKKKNDVSSQGPCCSKKKKENTICALTVPAQAFKSADHQCSSSRASATRYVLSLYLPKHSNLPNINARLREHPQHDMCSHCTCPSIQI